MFNEIIDVMKGIKLLQIQIHQNDIEKKRKKKHLRNSQATAARDLEEMEKNINFAISKEELIRAWKKHRPNSSANTPDEEEGGNKNPNQAYMTKLLKGLKSRKQKDGGPG
jgi:thiamine biosynthesis protein ThiC